MARGISPTSQPVEEIAIMNLIESLMTDCVILSPTRADDGEGGISTTWTPGATFRATIAGKVSSRQYVADKPESVSTYSVFTLMHLNVGDVFKRVSDNSTFRVVTGTKDMAAPPMSTIKYMTSVVERWELST